MSAANALVLAGLLYYTAGLLFMQWNMRRLGRSLADLASHIGADTIPGGKEILAVAALIAVLFWPIGVIDLMLSRTKP